MASASTFPRFVASYIARVEQFNKDAEEDIIAAKDDAARAKATELLDDLRMVRAAV